ncbi:sulfatase [Armatimonas sp.]|uniref:sulfatase family protein n=1 Tax=Armatimonas sp. TaxID=1872638 RepID=UPI00374CABEB
MKTKPNFVFFLTDDQPYNGLSCTGNPVLKTPHIDQLAAEGVLFEKAFVTTAICCCSRASIYTGQHMRRHGVADFKTPLSAAQWQQTFPALLRQAGYRTGFLGKFAIGAPQPNNALSLPAEQFDLWYGFPQMIAFKQVIDGKPRYLTTVMTDKAVAFLKETKKEQPFCLIVALKEPHGPLDYFDPEYKDPYTNATIPPPKNLNRASFEALPKAVQGSLGATPEWFEKPPSFQAALRKTYAYTSRADAAVGEICRALKEQGLDQNTVVIHLSDNGSMDGAHGLDGKWLMYEESIRVPLIIRDPRLPKSTRGRRSQMALNIDVAPTILAMAGVSIPKGMQGRDLQPILRSPKTKGREDWYYEHTYNTDPPRKPIPKSEGVRTERWKYIRYTEQQPPREQLFDLATDPQEERDLASDATHTKTLTRLRFRCDDYRKSLQL